MTSPELPSCVTVKGSPHHREIASLNPGDVTATRTQELKRAKLAGALREGGAYSLPTVMWWSRPRSVLRRPLMLHEQAIKKVLDASEKARYCLCGLTGWELATDKLGRKSGREKKNKKQPKSNSTRKVTVGRKINWIHNKVRKNVSLRNGLHVVRNVLLNWSFLRHRLLSRPPKKHKAVITSVLCCGRWGRGRGSGGGGQALIAVSS